MRTTLIVLTAIGSLSCGGGGGEPGAPTGPTTSTPPVATSAGEPTSDEWTLFTGQLAHIGNDSLQNALAPSVGTASNPFRVRAMSHLRPPAQDSTVTTQYFCCGNAGVDTQTTSHVLLDTSITITPGDNGSFTLAQNFRTVSTTDWISTTGGVRWRLDATDLRIFGTVRTAGGAVDAAQEFRLQGTVTYFLASGEARRADINVLLNYPNIESSQPTATGQAGPLQFAGQVLAPLVSPSRCSRPLEGCACANGCSGTAPCTKWPRCPGF
jgi:hypothetical protein